MNLTAQQRLERAHFSLVRDDGFMYMAGVIVYGKAKVVDRDITASTNGRDVRYGHQFLLSLTDPELRALVLHENFHKAFRHLHTWKHLYDINPKLANCACDYVINTYIKEREMQDGFVVLPKGGLYDPRFTGMSAGEVFRTLQDEDFQPDQGGFDDHDWEGAEEMDAEEAKELAKEMDDALRQGRTVSKKMGKSSDRSIDELLKPQIDWREVLRDFIQQTCSGKDISTWRRPNRRHMSQDIYMPSTYSETTERITMGVDTSGSISRKDLQEFLSEMQAACTTVRPKILDVIYWDDSVASHELYDFANLDTMSQTTKPKGGGGTDPTCVTTYMRENNIKPDCIVMLSDGDVYGDWGGEWPAPVLWCLNNKHNRAPTGVTVYIGN